MPRSVAKLYASERAVEGGGFPVRRPFPVPGLNQLDPFLLLDEMGPVTWKPGEAIGAPAHPHRGFETVTYLLAGELEHRDSGGHTGLLGPGDVQWMTAGRGVVHSELPSEQLKRHGGVTHGFQLWVNLPRSDKLMAPRYQELPRDSLPTVEGDGWWVRVIAGEAAGAHALIETRTPITYLHYRLEPGAQVEQVIARDQNVYVYVFKGSLASGEHHAREGQLLALAADADELAFDNRGTTTAECLVLGGRPLHEPVTRHGPFVMNTEAEILQAFADYRAGRLA